MGPLITGEHRDRVASYIGKGTDAGASAVVDGRQVQVDSDGFFLGASLLDHVTPDMDVYRDEIFGPVLCVVRADGYDDAVQLINTNPYGNGAAIFTRDGGAARRFQHEVEVGMVGINVADPVPVAAFSFGGWRSSLFGDSHMYGPEGCTSTRAARWSRRAGPTRPPARSTSASPQPLATREPGGGVRSS